MINLNDWLSKDNVKIVLSSNSQVYAKAIGETTYIAVPQSVFESLQPELKAKLVKDIQISPESRKSSNGKILDLNGMPKDITEKTEYNDEDEYARLKKAFPLNSGRTEKTDNVEKRNLKNRASKPKKHRYKGEKRQRIKAWILAAIAAAGLMYGAKEAIQGYGEYQYTAGTVENLSEEEIMGEIEDVLKKDISQATGTKVEDIEFYTEVNGTTSQTEIIKAGDKEFTNTFEFRSPGIFTNDTLKSEKLTKLIKAAKRGTREELIKTLRDARKFSAEYELVEEEGVLKAKKVNNSDQKDKTSVQGEQERIIEDDER